MASFGNTVITKKGTGLQAKTLAGKTVTFTRIALGDGQYSGMLVDATKMVNQILSLDLTAIKVIDESSVKVTSWFTNQDLKVGFFWRELGVFALDPDTNTETLYSYGNSGTQSEYIPPAGGADIVEKNVTQVFIVGSSERVAAVINESLVFATTKEIEGHLHDGQGSKNIPIGSVKSLADKLSYIEKEIEKNSSSLLENSSSLSENTIAIREQKTNLTNHLSDFANPHKINISQIGGCNENLLLNADFRDKDSVVNQRGLATYDFAAGEYSKYCVDCWKLGGYTGVSLALNDGYVTFKTPLAGMNCFFAQTIEYPKRFKEKNFTYSIIARNKGPSNAILRIHTGDTVKTLYTPISNEWGRYSLSVNITKDLTYLEASVQVYKDYETTVDIAAIKLEIGPESTLDNQPPQNYGVELAKCQRYYELVGALVPYTWTGSGKLYTPLLHFAVEKRIVPTVRYFTMSGGDNTVLIPTGSSVVAGASIGSKFPGKLTPGSIVVEGIDTAKYPIVCLNIIADANL